MGQTLPPSRPSHSIETSTCKRCGKCCKLFVFTGVIVTDTEWDILAQEIKSLNLPQEIFEICKDRKTLPIIGEKPPKKCAFLRDDNLCLKFMPHIFKETFEMS